MITPEHENDLRYHPPTPERAKLHEELRAACMAYVAVLDRIAPPSRHASLAYTCAEDSLHWANAALAIHGPQVE